MLKIFLVKCCEVAKTRTVRQKFADTANSLHLPNNITNKGKTVVNISDVFLVFLY